MSQFTELDSSILGPNPPQANKSLDPPTWLSQPSVRTALHVPSEGIWEQCASKDIFRNRTDGSLVAGDPYSAMPATNNLLSRMIEYTSNVIIGSGGLDMLIPTNGTLLVLQNVTWDGVQGFQRRPGKPVRIYFVRGVIELTVLLLTNDHSSSPPTRPTQHKPRWQASSVHGATDADSHSTKSI